MSNSKSTAMKIFLSIFN